MKSSSFDRYGVDKIGIHWMQYLSMTCISLLIFLVSLYKAVPAFKVFVGAILFKLQCSGFNCNGVN